MTARRKRPEQAALPLPFTTLEALEREHNRLKETGGPAKPKRQFDAELAAVLRPWTNLIGETPKADDDDPEAK